VRGAAPGPRLRQDVAFYQADGFFDGTLYLPAESFRRLGGTSDGDLGWIIGDKVEVEPDRVSLDGVEVDVWRVEANRLVLG
jgi:hypothetical protein